MNKHIGWLAADFWSILTMAILLFLHQPVVQPIKHDYTTLPDDTDLLRIVNGQYEVLHDKYWQGVSREYTVALRERLVIACNDTQQCADSFGKKAQVNEQLLIALPTSNKQKAEKLLYQECAIQSRCVGITIIHNGNEVTISQQIK